MKDYELSVLFHPDLEMNIDPALDKVRKTIENNGGKILKEDNDGKKRLAYSINDQDFAIYYYIDVSLPSEAPSKISSAFNISDEVMRYLLVRVDERKAKMEARKKALAKSEDETKEEKGD